MSKAEDLIAASFEEQKAMSRSVINDELVIDGKTREINVPESEMLFGVEGDVNIERKHFRCPKIVGDNIDLSKHLIYVAYVYTENQNNSFLPEIGIQSYRCTDVQIVGDDITFSWKLSGNVFKNPGFIAFKVFAKEKEESPLTVFNTTPAFGIVKMTIPDGNKEIAEEYPDIINQLLTKMESVEQIATPEAMQGYVDAYLKENPVTGGMTEEQEQQLNQNTEDISSLSEDMENMFKNVTYTTENGYLDNKGNVRTEIAAYVYSNGILLKYGETIVVATKVPSGNVSVIAMYNDGEYGEPLVVSNSSEYSFYKWTNTSSTYVYVSVCYINNNASKVFKLKSSDVMNAFRDTSIIGYQGIASVFSKYIDVFSAKRRNGYWGSNGYFSTETGIAFIVQLEKDKTYIAHIPTGEWNSRTDVVELETNEFTNGTTLVTIPPKSGVIDVIFTPKTTGIVGIAYNSHYTINDVYVAEFSKGAMTNAIKMLLDAENIEDKEQIFYVDHSGSTYENHYTSVIDCFNAIKNLEGHKKVYIYHGTYDIYEEMGGDNYFSQFTGDEEDYTTLQPFLDDIEIIGLGNVIFNFSMPSSIPSAVRFFFSPLNLRGNFYIENLTINGTNCRYCIHDESSSKYPNTVHEYKNIRCYKKGGSQAVGCGYSNSTILKIEDCIFEAEKSEAYSYHAKYGMNTVISNSVFKGPASNCVRFSQEFNSFAEVTMSNCYLGSPILLRPEYEYGGTGTERKCMTKLNLINTGCNVITENDYLAYDTVEEESTFYNTLTGESSVKVSKTVS